MKIQDIIFLITAAVLILMRKPKLLILAGLISLAFSVPLFAAWVFFTAEHLTWYAAGFFLIFIILSYIWPQKK